MKKFEINMMLNNVVSGFREIGESVSSPQRKVTNIIKTFTNGCYPVPVSYLELECGHSAKSIYVNARAYDRTHDDANHLAKPGSLVGCLSCLHYSEALARLQNLKPGDVQHSRFRTRDSRGFGKGDYYVYCRDASSPTGVVLLMSIEATKEVDELLCKLSASPLSPTEAR